MALAADKYHIFRGTTLQDCLDQVAAENPVASVAAGTATVDIVGEGHVADQEYWYIIAAVSAAGVVETSLAEIVRVMVDGGGTLAGQPPNRVSWAEATPAAAGKINFYFVYSARGELGEATSIEVARVTDGQADWGSLVADISISGDTRKTVELGPTFGDRETVHLAARAKTAAGETGQALSLRPVGADADAPDHVGWLEVSPA